VKGAAFVKATRSKPMSLARAAMRAFASLTSTALRIAYVVWASGENSRMLEPCTGMPLSVAGANVELRAALSAA
jgi:hypothetical protein